MSRSELSRPQRPEPNTPPLKQNDANRRLADSINALPPFPRHTLAGAPIRTLIKPRQGRRDTGAQSAQSVEGKGDIMGGGLAAVLEQRVVGVGSGEGEEVGVGEVDVVDGEDGGGEGVGRGLEEGAQGGCEGGFAGALEALEADDEGLGGGEVGEDEGEEKGGFF
jgi:hypothetical protein